MVRAESELVQISIHMFLADRYVCSSNSVLEHAPEAFDSVRMVKLLGPVVVDRPLLLALLDGNVRVAFPLQ